MQTPTTPVKMDTPYGPLYVAVIAAERYSYHDSERGHVTKMRPRVRVASDPEFAADPNAADHWTIRGCAYGVHRVIFFEDRTHITYANGYQEGRWHHADHTPYQGGFRNDKRKSVKFRTVTYDLMRKTVSDALDAFAAQHPGWEGLSRYVLLWGEADTAHVEANKLRREAEELDAKRAALETEATSIAVTLPDSLMELADNVQEN